MNNYSKKKVWFVSRVDQSLFVANSLLKGQQLSRWDTFAVFNQKYKKIFKKFINISDKRFISEELNFKTKNNLTSEFVRRFLKIINYPEANVIGDKLFSYLKTFNTSKNFSILHCQAGYGLDLMKKFRKNDDIGIVSDHFGSLKHTLVNQLKNEYTKFDIKFKVYNEKILDRREQEAKISDKIIVPSSFLADEFIKLGFKKSKIKIISYRSYLANKILKISLSDIEEQRKKDNNKLRLLCVVGTISIAKGVQYLLQSLQWLKKKYKSDITLTLVGLINGESKKILKKFNVKLNLFNFVNDEQLINLFVNHDIFINPTLNESSSLVNLEAMSAGLPVITTYDSGTPITHNYDGCLISPRNSEQIKENIIRLFDTNLRRKMGFNARLKIEKIFNKSLLNELNEVYNDI